MLQCWDRQQIIGLQWLVKATETSLTLSFFAHRERRIKDSYSSNLLRARIPNSMIIFPPAKNFGINVFLSTTEMKRLNNYKKKNCGSTACISKLTLILHPLHINIAYTNELQSATITPCNHMNFLNIPRMFNCFMKFLNCTSQSTSGTYLNSKEEIVKGEEDTGIWFLHSTQTVTENVLCMLIVKTCQHNI